MDNQLTGYKCDKCGKKHQPGIALSRLRDCWACGECIETYWKNQEKATEHLWVRENGNSN